MNLIMGFPSKYKKNNYCIEDLELKPTEGWINWIGIWIIIKSL